MPKRNHKNDDSDYLRRKLRKIERKLAKRDKRLRDRSSSRSTSRSSAVGDTPGAVLVDSEHEDESQLDPELAQGIVDDNQLGTSTSTADLAAGVPPLTIPPAVTESAVETPELDEEILILLGGTPSKEKKFGPEIRGELAVRWEHIATTGLSKESKKELLEKHLIPKNCKIIDAPKLNPEIKAALSDMLIKKDKALENKQKQVAAGISCISEALTRLFSLEQRDTTVIKLLVEAGQLMCDTQYRESMTRRGFICSTIKKDIKDQLFDTQIDDFLFGEKLSDTLKAAKAISKSGAEIKVSPPMKKTTSTQRSKPASFQALNPRPPLPTTRQAGAARRSEPAPTSTPRPRQPQQQRQPQRSQRQPHPRR